MSLYLGYTHKGLPFTIGIQGDDLVMFDHQNPEIIKAIEDPADTRIIEAIRWARANFKNLEASNDVWNWAHDTGRIVTGNYRNGLPKGHLAFHVIEPRAIEEIEFWSPKLRMVINSDIEHDKDFKSWASRQLLCLESVDLSIDKIRAIRTEIAQNYERFSRQLRKRDGKQCRHCGTDKLLEIDHIFPVSRGGGNELDNLQFLCRNCNAKKRATVPE